jgi:hypothetical protein
MRNLIFVLLLAGPVFSQPDHARLLTQHDLSDSGDNHFLHVENRRGQFLLEMGWKAVDENSQLFIQCKDTLPKEGSLLIDVTHFNPVEQNLHEIKHHIINLYSRVYTNNKDIFNTIGSWCNIRTGSWYSDGPGKAGFKLLAAPEGIDTRSEARCIQSATWDLDETYTFRITWTTSTIYCFLDDKLITSLPFGNQAEPFRYILIGKDNLIWGYSAQPGPIYKNLRLYIPGDSIPAFDETPPQLLSVQALSNTQIKLEFDEPLDRVSAVNLAHYRLEPQKGIVSAVYSDKEKAVTLVTEPLEEHVAYELFVQNIIDASPQANTLAQSSLAFEYSNQLIITNLTPGHYKVSHIAIGDSVYIDRDFRLVSWPNDDTYHWIRTANDDKYSTDPSFLTFMSNKAIQIKIAIDSDNLTFPGWIENEQWQKTDQTVKTEDTLYELWEKKYSPGQIVLGGNEGDRSSSMYLVMIREYPTTGIDTVPPAAPVRVRIDRK